MSEVSIVVPHVGEAGMDLTFVRWLREVGDVVTEGDDLFEVDTEKTSLIVEAAESGVLRVVTVGEGDLVVAMQVIGTLEADGSA